MPRQTAALKHCEPSLSPARPRALVAEADELLRDRIAAALRGAGYEVVEARDGFEALDAILALPWRKAAPGVNLVLAAADMPGYDGLEVLARLRSMGDLTPFILMDPGRHPATCRDAARLGADRILEVPSELDEVTSAAFGLAPVHRRGA